MRERKKNCIDQDKYCTNMRKEPRLCKPTQLLIHAILVIFKITTMMVKSEDVFAAVATVVRAGRFLRLVLALNALHLKLRARQILVCFGSVEKQVLQLFRHLARVGILVLEELRVHFLGLAGGLGRLEVEEDKAADQPHDDASMDLKLII